MPLGEAECSCVMTLSRSSLSDFQPPHFVFLNQRKRYASRPISAEALTAPDQTHTASVDYPWAYKPTERISFLPRWENLRNGFLVPLKSLISS